MLSSIITLATVISVSCAVSNPRSPDALYVHIPIEFLYGADSRVTTNITFGTSNDTQPITVVMDTGSANAWVIALLCLSSLQLTSTDMATKRHNPLGLALPLRSGTLQHDRPYRSNLQTSPLPHLPCPKHKQRVYLRRLR